MKTDRQKRREYFRMQKLFGLALTVLTILFMTFMVLVLNEKEVGMMLLIIPLGLYLVFTKDMVLDIGYKIEVDKRKKQRAQ